jgi:heme/copper-type cytochrome/quinol oxidase subunit 4
VIALLRTPATAIWAVLIFATVVSWTLGSENGFHDHKQVSVIILLIAFIKLRLIGLYFMELRSAPRVLHGLFETYCLVVGTVVTGVFVLAC